MNFFLLILYCTLVLSCKTIDKSGNSAIQAWDPNRFSEMATKVGAKGWAASPKGGRGWTVKDELKYDEFLTSIDTNIMMDWDLPADCADAALNLRFIFAYTEGLALKFGNFLSTNYAEEPIEFIRAVNSVHGTANIDVISYRLDMWHPNNLRGGSFFLSGGHTHNIVHYEKDDFFTDFTSMPPFDRTKPLSKSRFQIPGISGGRVHFRRFYAIKRNLVGQLRVDKETSFEAHPNAHNEPIEESWYNCIRLGDKRKYWRKDQVSLPKNIQNILLSARLKPDYNLKKIKEDGLFCQHNLFWRPEYIKSGSEVPNHPYKNIDETKRIRDMLCKMIEKRHKLVIKGSGECSYVMSDEEDDCESGAAALYSTYNFDIEFFGKYKNLFFDPLWAGELINEQGMGECKMNFHYEDEQARWYREDYSYMKYPILEVDSENNLVIPEWINCVFNPLEVVKREKRPYDPKVDVLRRWRCPK